MILTTRGRYAVMAVIELLEGIDDHSYDHSISRPVSLLAISKRQNISLSYLEQIFSNLRKSGIVRSVKGPGGGYVLKKLPKEITIAEIIAATGELIRMTDCGNKVTGCKMAANSTNNRCRTHDLWHGLEKNIYNYLSSISLQDFYRK